MDANDRKNILFSIIIISYNQENYIKEAILSTFNQDFNDYEIIISDDCSSDNTWNIIVETVEKEKRKKNISTILNRNTQNLGIVRNYQKALSLTKGTWLVASAGDDLSDSNRLRVLNDIINRSEKIYAIGTGYDLIDSSGKYISRNIPCIKKEILLPLYPGFSAAIKRDTYTLFPEIIENIQSEDIVYTLRALELGEIILSNISTVKHRIHSRNITSKGTTAEAYQGKIVNHQNAIKTLEYYKENELKNTYLTPIIDRQIKKFENNIKHYEFILSFYKMNILEKVANFRKIEQPPGQNRFKAFLYRAKIFFESYKFLSQSIPLAERTYSMIKNFNTNARRKQLQEAKLYHL